MMDQDWNKLAKPERSSGSGQVLGQVTPGSDPVLADLDRVLWRRAQLVPNLRLIAHSPGCHWWRSDQSHLL